MAEPAWKIAVREKKKLKEEAEKKKQAEREAYLASLPAWKRPMALKKLEEAGVKENKTSASSISTTSNPQSKWENAMKKIQHDQTEPQPRPESSKIPPWKQAMEERKKVAAMKKQLEESPTTKRRESTPLSPVRQELETKNNLAQVKQQFEKRSEESPPLTKKKSPQTNRKQTFTEVPLNTTPPASPVAKEPSSSPDFDHASSPTSKETDSLETKDTSSNQEVDSTPAAPVADEMDPELMAMPPWKRELVLLKRKKAKEGGSSTKSLFKKPQSKSTGSLPTLSQLKSTGNVLWKGHQPVTKNTQEQQDNTSQQQEPKSQQQDSSSEQQGGAKEDVKKPDIVNASDKSDETDSPKLVKKEGKSLRAPVFKPASKWADIAEDSPEFQKLPLWKQELIRRRKQDVANRTAPVKTEVIKEEKKPEPPISTPWERLNKTSGGPSGATSDKGHPSNTSYDRQQPAQQNKPVTASNASDIPASGVSKVQSLLGRFGADQVVKRKIPPSAVPPPAPRENGLEVTLIDEEPSDDEAPVTPPTLKTTRSSSILKSPLKKNTTPRSLRRISWSDSNISHYYPKYDYFDYDEIVQDPVPPTVVEETDAETNPSSPDSKIATPIHPWLATPSTVKSPPPSSTGTGGSVHNFASSFGSLGSFMSMYTSSPSSSPAKPVAAASSMSTQPASPAAEEDQSSIDVYANLDSDTAALLF